MQDSFENFGEVFRGVSPTVLGFGFEAGGLAHFAAKFGAAGQGEHGLCQGFLIARRDDEAGAAVLQGGGLAAFAGCDRGQAGSLIIEELQARIFLPAAVG
jgi:hypothetical protein